MTHEMMLKRLLDIQIGTKAFDYSKYESLKKDLEEAVRTDNNKARGCGNLAKLAKAIFKEAPEHCKPMHYAHVSDGIQYVLDGYRIAGFYSPLDLPEFDDYKERENMQPTWYNVEQMFNNLEYDDTPLQLPTIGELKSTIKITKAGKPRGIRVMWKLECGPLVNAQYLLDFMEAFPDMKIYASAKQPMVNPLFIEADKGFGLLLPIHMNHEMETGIHTERY